MSDINYILSTITERQQVAQTVANSQSEKLATIEEGATADQTADEIRALSIHSVMGESSRADGATQYAAGLVLAGNSTHGNEFLRKDGTWAAAGGNSKAYATAFLSGNTSNFSGNNWYRIFDNASQDTEFTAVPSELIRNSGTYQGFEIQRNGHYNVMWSITLQSYNTNINFAKLICVRRQSNNTETTLGISILQDHSTDEIHKVSLAGSRVVYLTEDDCVYWEAACNADWRAWGGSMTSSASNRQGDLASWISIHNVD